MKNLSSKIIEYSFYLLFLIVPLILTPYNYELFEYNKMMSVYGLTAVITGTWIIKMISNRKFRVAHTPLDLPLSVFLISQIVSTVFSVDPHISVFGYYSRFNGGLLSIISYFLLYFAFTTNFPKEKIKKLIMLTLFSGAAVSVYAILEHLGIDKHLWVQDVQNRVFSTLGQPNWLAAYLSVLIPVSLGFLLSRKSKNMNLPKPKKNTKTNERLENSRLFSLSNIVFILLIGIFYLALIYTKSRSGFIGFWSANAALWFMLFIKYKKQILKYIVIFNIGFLAINFLFGAPFDLINKFSLPILLQNTKIEKSEKPEPAKPAGSSIIDIGITESGNIRKIVWQGAWDAFLHHPIIGTGVETFFIAYYKYRPQTHNMTSEWDFLYNKAHNEYLNYAATTGISGLGTYLILIGAFVLWNIKKLKNSRSEQTDNPLSLMFLVGIFSGWLSILVTNFFGFSVVVIQLFFYLLPAISFKKAQTHEKFYSFPPEKSLSEDKFQSDTKPINSIQKIASIGVLFLILYSLYVLSKFWLADTYFANGYNAGLEPDADIYSEYTYMKKAISLNSSEPLYYDSLSLPAAQLALAFSESPDNASLSAELEKEAVLSSDYVVTQSPYNVNFFKNRTRVFYTLSSINSEYLQKAVESLEKARILSPTDPNISYNLALMYGYFDKKEKTLELLEETVRLKPDYKDAFTALGVYYEEEGNPEKARQAYSHILERIDPEDELAREKLEELR